MNEFSKYYCLPKHEVRRRIKGDGNMDNLKDKLEELKRQIKDKDQLIAISEAINLDSLVVVLYDDLDFLVSQAYILETKILKMEGKI